MAKNNKLPFHISHSSCVNGSMCPCQSLLGHSNDLDLVVMSVGPAVASERLMWAFVKYNTMAKQRGPNCYYREFGRLVFYFVIF